MDKDAPAPPADALADLADIPLPAPVSLWPQTWQSQLVIVLLVIGLVATIWWLVHRHHVNRYRRIALAELAAIDRKSPRFVSDLALLVRRTALAAFPRADVAALSDGRWLSFLDRTYGGTGFSQGAGRVLGSALYESVHAVPAENSDLTSLVAHWIRTHHA